MGHVHKLLDGAGKLLAAATQGQKQMLRAEGKVPHNLAHADWPRQGKRRSNRWQFRRGGKLFARDPII